jgi:N-acetyl-beta-hexosaminidase
VALAEVVWSSVGVRDWADFQRRLPWQLRLLDQHGVSYRNPDGAGLERDR